MEDAVVYQDHVERVLTDEYERLHELALESLERNKDIMDVLETFGVEDLGELLHNHSSGDVLSRELEHVIRNGWMIENELNFSIEEIPIFPRGFDPS